MGLTGLLFYHSHHHSTADPSAVFLRKENPIIMLFRVGPFKITDHEDAMRVLYVGIAGSGKSSLINVQRLSMLQSGVIQGALDVDNTGKTYDFYRHFAKKGSKVYRVGMHYNDCVGIHYAKLCKSPAARKQFADAIVEQLKGDNQFFTKSGTNIVEKALSLCHAIAPERWYLADALRIAIFPALHEYLAKEYKKEPPYRNLNEKTAGDVKATIDTQLRPHLMYAMADMNALPPRIDFPLLDGFLVLEWTAQYDAALRSTYTFLVNNLATHYLSLFELPPMGLFIDEFRYLGKLEDLGRFLAQGRKYGVYVVGSLHNLPGLKAHFGPELALEIMALFDYKMILKLSCPETADYLSRCVGDKEFLRELRNRQGNWSASIDRSPHVLPSEFFAIPKASYEKDLICGIKCSPGESQRFMSKFRHSIVPKGWFFQKKEDDVPLMNPEAVEPQELNIADFRRLGISITPELLDILEGKKKEKKSKEEKVIVIPPKPPEEKRIVKKNYFPIKKPKPHEDDNGEGGNPSPHSIFPFF